MAETSRDVAEERRILVNEHRETEGTIIRAKSPLRISFVGGGTDLPHYYEDHGGAVLSSTINRYAYVTLSPRTDDRVRIRSFDLGYSVKYRLSEEPVYDGTMDLAKAAIERMDLRCGLDLDVRSDAPPGSGLGGSSAVTSAILGALTELTGQGYTNYELAELNYEVERVDLEISGGKQDQYATAFGGFNVIEFSPDRVVVNPLRIPASLRNDLEYHLLLCYTGGVRPDLGLVDRQRRYYAEGREETLEGMRRLRQMVPKMKEALLTGALDDFGRMIDEAYAAKKKMNPHVAEGTPADALYEKAREIGAVGGKLCGAGGGGYLLLYCQTDRQHAVREALEEDGGQFTDFAFEEDGLQTWRSTCR